MSRDAAAVRIRISDDLRAILRGPSHAPVSRDDKIGVVQDTARPEISDEWTDLALRCDGRRPTRFRGLVLRSAHQGTSCGSDVRLSVYLADDGRIFGHCVISTSPVIAARDMLVGRWITDPGAMARFITAGSPKLSLHPCSKKDATGHSAQVAAIDALQNAYQFVSRQFLRRPCPQTERITACP